MKKILFGLLFFSIVTSCNATKQNDENSKANDQNGNPPTVEEIFKQMDANKDGKLSKAEVKGPLIQDFTKVDTNKDGFISKEELKKAPKPKKPQGPPPTN